MFDFPSDAEVNAIRQRYPAGTRIRLIYTDDPYTTLRHGDTGIVRHVDDAGTVHINWDCGSRLGLVPGVDSFETI